MDIIDEYTKIANINTISTKDLSEAVEKIKNTFSLSNWQRMADATYVATKTPIINMEKFLAGVQESNKNLFEKEYDCKWTESAKEADNFSDLKLLMEENNLTQDKVIEMIKWHLNK